MKTRSILRRMLSAAALLSFASTASAQNPSTWSGGGGNGNWSTAGNWDIVPTSNNDTDLIFGGTTNLSTNQNITTGTTPFVLSTLTVLAGTSDFSISGAPLTFSAGTTTPTGINYQTAAGRLLINSAVTFSANSTLNIDAGANNAAGAEIFLAGPITNTATLTLQTTPAATLLVITGKNNTNFAGTAALTASTLIQLGNFNAMWRTTAVTFAGTCAMTTGTTTAAGYGILDAGYNQQIGSAAGPGQFLVGTTDSASTALVGFRGGNQTLNGPAGLAGFNPGSHFGKVGTGTLTVSGENASFNMGLSVREGNILLSGGLGALVNSLANAGPLTVYSSAQLRLSNTTAPATGATPMNAQGRISDTVAIRLAGGTLRLDGPSVVSTLGQLEQAGQIRVLAGQSIVVVNANAAQSVRFNFASVNEGGTDLTRGGQVAFAGPSLGLTPAAGVAGITFTSAPTTVNGIIPWGLSQTTYAVGGTTLTDAVNTFAFDALAELGPNGVRPLITFVNDDLSSLSQNVRLTTAGTTGSANSLTIATGGSASGSVAVGSGAVMNTATTASVGGLTTTGRLYVNGAPSTVLTVGTISAASLSKGGAGTTNVGALNLTGTSPIISVNAGTLNITGTVSVGGGAPIFQVTRQGTLSGLTTIGGTLRGNGTVVGPITMTTGSLLGGSTLASDVGGAAGTTGAAPGTLAVTGTLAFTGGTNTRLRFYMTSVFGGAGASGGVATQGLVTATTLDLTGVTPAAPLTVQPHSIALANTDNANVYDFDPAQNYSWTLIQSTSPIVGFNASAFNVDLANFTNPTAGTFTVATSGNNLVLNYATSIPEPGLFGVVGLGLLGLARLRRKV